MIQVVAHSFYQLHSQREVCAVCELYFYFHCASYQRLGSVCAHLLCSVCRLTTQVLIQIQSNQLHLGTARLEATEVEAQWQDIFLELSFSYQQLLTYLLTHLLACADWLNQNCVCQMPRYASAWLEVEKQKYK